MLVSSSILEKEDKNSKNYCYHFVTLFHLKQDKSLLEFDRVGYEDEADRYLKFLIELIRNNKINWIKTC